MDHENGQNPASVARETISLRIDSDVLDRLRSVGPDWQDRINDILRAAVQITRDSGMRPEELNAENDD